MTLTLPYAHKIHMLDKYTVVSQSFRAVPSVLNFNLFTVRINCSEKVGNYELIQLFTYLACSIFIHMPCTAQEIF